MPVPAGLLQANCVLSAWAVSRAPRFGLRSSRRSWILALCSEAGGAIDGLSGQCCLASLEVVGPLAYLGEILCSHQPSLHHVLILVCFSCRGHLRGSQESPVYFALIASAEPACDWF